MARADAFGEWEQAYATAVSGDSVALAGYYNDNYAVSHNGQTVLVRIPIVGSPAMDVRVLPEVLVMQVAREAGLPVPRVLGWSSDPRFAVHQFIPADSLDQLLPRGKELPRFVIDAAVNAQVSLLGADASQFDVYLESWPRSGDSRGFYLRLLDEINIVCQRHWISHGWLFEQLLLPADPLARLRPFADVLHSRPFGLLHGDLHRKNLLLRGSQVWIIDWELSLVGDPAYEVAVHLHKMGYRPDEESAYLLELRRLLPTSYQTGLFEDVSAYLKLERAKSVIVDVVRYREQLLDAATSAATERILLRKLEQKLSWVEPFWGNLVPEQAVLRRMLLSDA